LLTNDDGITAPGLVALYEAAEGIGERFVVAPAHPQSGCSHRVTTDEPLMVEMHRPRHFAVAGTPGDCVRVALHRVVPDLAWVLSGINAGGNLGADVYYSGTVAAVREAVLHGRPGIAFSHYFPVGATIDWPRAIRLARPILSELMSRRWQLGRFWNVNLPYLEPGQPDPPIVECPLDPTPLPLDFREEGDRLHYEGDYHRRGRMAGGDVEACFKGWITITEMRLFD
jgi:5'-nucleotidase